MKPSWIFLMISIVWSEERCCVPNLHELAILLLRLQQHLAFSGIMAAWFFHVDVLARLQPGDGHWACQ